MKPYDTKRSGATLKKKVRSSEPKPIPKTLRARKARIAKAEARIKAAERAARVAVAYAERTRKRSAYEAARKFAKQGAREIRAAQKEIREIERAIVGKPPKVAKRHPVTPSSRRPSSKALPKTERARKARITKAEVRIKAADRAARSARTKARRTKKRSDYACAREAEAFAEKETRKANKEIRTLERAIADEKRKAKRQQIAEKKTKERVKAIVDAQQKARGKRRTSRAKKQIEVEERALERARLEAAVVTEEPSPKKRRTTSQRHRIRSDVRAQMFDQFERLLEHAQKTDQLPGRERSGPFESRENIGDQRYVRIDQILDATSVETILYKVRAAAKKLPGRYPVWYSRLDISGMGDRLFASGQRMLDTSGLQGDRSYAEFFQTQGYDSTGIWNTRQSMLVRLEHMLEEYAATPRTIVYLQGIRVRNFDKKTGR